MSYSRLSEGRPMPRYIFSLRTGDGAICEREGCDLENADAAMRHAKGVVWEWMKNRELRTRHWQMHVRADSGEVLARLCFAPLDPTLDHLVPEWRQDVEDLSRRCLALREATSAARDTILQSRALVARSKGRPHLVTHRWGRLTNSI